MTCKEVLLQHLKDNPKQWHKKSHLYAVAEDWSPETVGRRLRELEDEGRVRVGYYDGRRSKGLSMYAYAGVPQAMTRVEVVNGKAVMKTYYE